MKEFYQDIVTQTIELVKKGSKKVLLWGVKSDLIFIITELKKLGIDSAISGVINHFYDEEIFEIHRFKLRSPNEVTQISFDTMVVASDEHKEDILKQFSKLDERIPKVIISGTKHMEFRDDDFYKLKSSCLVKSYANGYPNTLIHIFQAIKYLSKNNLKGDVVEFGIFKGGTTVFISKVLKHFGFSDSKIYGFDIFDGFPKSKTLFDLYSNAKCEFNDYDSVVNYCSNNSIEVVKGDICDTHKILEDKKLMLTFFDTDNYSPSRTALETCYKQTVKGGIFAFDHYVTEERFIYTIGERLAAIEFFEGKNVFHLHNTGIFMKMED